MSKTKKFILKSIYFIPFGFLLWIIPIGFEIEKIIISLIAGTVIALFIVFWNLFEYEKFNEITENDFLESTHSISIENNVDNWNRLRNVINIQFVKVKKIKETENVIEVQINRRITDSILKIEKLNDKIKLKIKRKYLSFIPDMAENYKTLKKIV